MTAQSVMRLLRVAVFAFLSFSAMAETRTVTSLDLDWRFQRGDFPEARAASFDDHRWQSVRVPQDWSIAGPVDEHNPSGQGGGFFPTGVAWYRRTLTLLTAPVHRKTWIVFDGVMANSDVFCNGTLLGHRPYGYVSFQYDVTACLRAGANVIAVRTDTSQQPASRWYAGSGINRHVRLVSTSEAHIAPWGTFVTTPGEVAGGSAIVHVRATVQNESVSTGKLSLRVVLERPDGTAAHGEGAESKTVEVRAGGSVDLDTEMTVDKPQLWDLDHPALYTVRATLLRDGKAVDEERVPFGIRSFRFDPNQGFFLNGVHHKIFGVALHTDAGALGTAVPLGAWERRLAALRSLGVNAIRTAHNPPAPEFLDLSDRMGFLVMDEMFDAWTVAKNPYDYHLYFRDWSARDTADTVRRDRNHPSIILYSAGNEIHDTPKPEVAIPILKSLVATFHANDPTRPVTQALFRPNASHDYEDGLADLLDVVGQNYREQEILAAHAQKPSRAIVGTENTHGRDQWVPMRDHPEYSGQFLWTGIDYLGEAGKWPAIGSGSGLLLTTSLPRARAYERQSWWAEVPMVRIARRVAPTQRAPTDPGYEAPNQAAPTRFSQTLLLDWTPVKLDAHTEEVEVYTNADEVELTLNGRSLGTEKRHADASPIRYQVPFSPGSLTATARTAGKVVAEDTLRTAGKPARLELSSSEPGMTPGWDDVAYVRATLVDEQGVTVPSDAVTVRYALSGPGLIAAVDNGNMLDHESFLGTDRTLYQGNAFAIVRAVGASGRMTVSASAHGVVEGQTTLSIVAPKKVPEMRSF